jgi:transposase
MGTRNCKTRRTKGSGSKVVNLGVEIPKEWIKQMESIPAKEKVWTDEKIAFVMKYKDDYKYGDISEIIGVTRSALESQVHKIKNKGITVGNVKIPKKWKKDIESRIKRDDDKIWTGGKVAFLKKYINTHNLSDIAKVMGITPKSVYETVRRLRKKGEL